MPTSTNRVFVGGKLVKGHKPMGAEDASASGRVANGRESTGAMDTVVHASAAEECGPEAPRG